MNPLLTHLECTGCGDQVDAGKLQQRCGCGATYYARYDLTRAAELMPRDALVHAVPSLWRYRQVLPLAPDRAPVTLGEGNTPTLSARRLGATLGLDNLFLKDESANPTGSFKARGMTTAVSVAATLGAPMVALPSAGNAALAAAAYCARIGMPLRVYLPVATPPIFLAGVRTLGAQVETVEGSIADAKAKMARDRSELEFFSLATLEEPYRIEGKKTLGYELAEAFDWQLPEVVIYPTGGGTGLLGMWKAFEEMEAMGWIDSRRPRMVAVQADGCAPLVGAFARGSERGDPVQNPQTVASGLRVPGTIGDFIILRILRESGGTAVSVSDRAILSGVSALGRATGVFGAPEAGATVAAARHLRRTGFLAPGDRVVLFVTGTGLSYVTP